MFVMLLGSYASAQEFSVNIGSSFVSESVKTPSYDDDQSPMGYLELSGDILKKSKLRLAPLAKLYVYEGGLKKATSSIDNNYFISAGAEVGYDFTDEVTFAVGYELPIPGAREDIFESIISPSLILYDNKSGFGLKINYDYYVNKKLFEYHSSVTAGIVYKFN